MRIGGHGDDCNDGDTDRIDLGVENKGIHDFAPFFLHIQVFMQAFMQVFMQTICACLRYRTDRTGKGKRKKAFSPERGQKVKIDISLLKRENKRK